MNEVERGLEGLYETIFFARLKNLVQKWTTQIYYNESGIVFEFHSLISQELCSQIRSLKEIPTFHNAMFLFGKHSPFLNVFFTGRPRFPLISQEDTFWPTDDKVKRLCERKITPALSVIEDRESYVFAYFRLRDGGIFRLTEEPQQRSQGFVPFFWTTVLAQVPYDVSQCEEISLSLLSDTLQDCVDDYYAYLASEAKYQTGIKRSPAFRECFLNVCEPFGSGLAYALHRPTEGESVFRRTREDMVDSIIIVSSLDGLAINSELAKLLATLRPNEKIFFITNVSSADLILRLNECNEVYASIESFLDSHRVSLKARLAYEGRIRFNRLKNLQSIRG